MLCVLCVLYVPSIVSLQESTESSLQIALRIISISDLIWFKQYITQNVPSVFTKLVVLLTFCIVYVFFMTDLLEPWQIGGLLS